MLPDRVSLVSLVWVPRGGRGWCGIFVVGMVFRGLVREAGKEKKKSRRGDAACGTVLIRTRDAHRGASFVGPGKREVGSRRVYPLLSRNSAYNESSTSGERETMEGDRRYGGGAASPASVSSVPKAAERDVAVEDEVSAGVSEGEEGESDRDDEGLELGLTLGAARKWNPPPVPWSPFLRILTAKDLPSLASLAPPSPPSASSVSSSSVTNLRGGGTGRKRSDESASPDVGGSPQPPSQMVVGWPPIRAFRMNSLFNQSKEHTPETTSVAIKKSVSKDQSCKDQGGRRTEMRNSMFVKVKMDGDPIGRKVDLNAHHSYEALAVSLELMFQKPTMATNLLVSFDGAKALKLSDSSSEFALTYEDKDGDWMLVGDVPWGMFVETAKRLRIMKISDATGLSI